MEDDFTGVSTKLFYEFDMSCQIRISIGKSMKSAEIIGRDSLI